MKCEYCGNPLSLETENCPHCGRVNKHGQQHAMAMRQYKTDYEQTKQDVYKTTRRFTQVSIRMIIVAAMIILIVGGWCLFNNVGYLVRTVETINASIQKNSKIAQIDAYMKEGEYIELASFYEKNQFHNVVGYNSWYQNVYSACVNYRCIYLGIMELYHGRQTAEIPSEYEIEELSNRVSALEEMVQQENYASNVLETESSTYEQMLLDMEQDIHLLFQVYGGFTEEDIQSFYELTPLGIESLIVERMVY